MQTTTLPDVDHVIVTGRLVPHGKRYKTVASARRAVDRFDLEYGASAHSYKIVYTEDK